uniref:Uncharacterized protein n=1 Tax=Chromera velia CCMP2878 TaxID=1169474 RepID=A0A0G4FF38_9ALVE|eukprot:Cvel_3248.t1-p1 / transcript=Cvel_3248.t1 / gene=Cvel_3248 / organism=Chromera_velia_CCMP2878 / gene_product=Phytoene desaturase, putative / transcript_product=Phytoene desaturase, putative / location=Cvel_scaffold127:84150-86107(+) / protein_length=541 / sequence_SO=supercontig / SO=protein_coding / is_pseudo=false
MAQRFFRSTHLQAFAVFQDLYVGLSPFEAPAVFSLLQAIEFREGIWYPLGGFRSIMQKLAEGVTNPSDRKVPGRVRVLSDRLVTGVIHSGSSVEGVRVVDLQKRRKREPAEEFVTGDIFVLNGDLPAWEKLFERAGEAPDKPLTNTSSGQRKSAAKEDVGGFPAGNLGGKQPGKGFYGGQSMQNRFASSSLSTSVVSLHLGLGREFSKAGELNHHSIFLAVNNTRLAWDHAFGTFQQDETIRDRTSGMVQGGLLRSVRKGMEEAESRFVREAEGIISVYATLTERLQTYSRLARERLSDPEKALLPAFDFNFYVHAPSRTEKTGDVCPQGKDAITVLFPVPPLPTRVSDALLSEDPIFSQGTPKSETQRTLLEAVRKQEAELKNAVRDAVLLRMSLVEGMEDFEDQIVLSKTVGPTDWLHKFRLQGGAVFGLAHPLWQLWRLRPGPLWSPPREVTLGLGQKWQPGWPLSALVETILRGLMTVSKKAERGSTRNSRTRLRNLFACGASCKPGNGVPLVMTGARQTADEILSLLRQTRKSQDS